MPKSINRWDVSGQYVRGPARLGGSGLKETVLKLPNPKFAQFTALTLNEFFEGYEQEIARLQVRVQELDYAARYVRDTFKKDLDQGYHTKDKEFAVSILSEALK